MEKNLIVELENAIACYTTSQKTVDLVTKSNLLILCGISGAGKNTITKYLHDNKNYSYLISHTTRMPRENHTVIEKNGVDYWFVTEKKMLDLINQQAFVEVKMVHGKTVYGTSVMALQEALKINHNVVTEIDVQGAIELTKIIPSYRPLFVLPPSYDVWVERLSQRGPMSSLDQSNRLQSAYQELSLVLHNSKFLLLVNTEVADTVTEIINGVDNSTVTQAERRSILRMLLAELKKNI
ncbi:MAG: guanylate kinase [Candidatus Saccharimonadales bacterium]